MEKAVKEFIDYLNQVLNLGTVSIDDYSDYLNRLIQKTSTLNEKLNLKFYETEGAPSAKYNEEEKVIEIYINPNNSFHTFLADSLNEFLEDMEYIEKTLELFTKLIEDFGFEGFAKLIIKVSVDGGFKDVDENYFYEIIEGAKTFIDLIMEDINPDIDLTQLINAADQLENAYYIKQINSALSFIGENTSEGDLGSTLFDISVMDIKKNKVFK